METRSETKFVCVLPEGYDERTRLTSYEGRLIVAHPDFKPVFVKEDGTLEEVKPCHPFL